MMDPEELARQFNHNMVDLLIQGGQIRTPAIERAFREVLRHQFLPPDINVAEVYQDRTIVLKEAAAGGPLPPGMPLSSSTMPGLLASILEAAELRPGMHAMQIGTGPGYLAALMANLVTDSGRLVTVEVDVDMAERAGRKLHSLGHLNVRCVCADGSLGYPPAAPYQRIIVTASCAEVPQAWMDQLDRDGLLILPFSPSQRAGLYPVIAFQKQGERLLGTVASSLVTVGFIPLYGQGVACRVLYEQSIADLESAAFRQLRQSGYQGEAYRAILLVVLLEIARAVQSGAGAIGSMDPGALGEKSIELWKHLHRPKVRDFHFHLLPAGRSKEDNRWHFRKDLHELFVTVRSDRSVE